MVLTTRNSRGRWKFVVAIVLSLITGSFADAQSAEAPDSARVPMPAGQDTTRRAALIPAPLPLSPTMLRLTSMAMGGAALYGMTGAMVGSLEDTARCKRNHPGDRRGLFGDWCDLYFSDGTRIGWFAGSFVGATASAVVGARRRGCPTRRALWRAAGGSIIGMIPGIITAATPSRNSPAPRSMMLASGPLLGGLGAALAVRNCHR